MLSVGECLFTVLLHYFHATFMLSPQNHVPYLAGLAKDSATIENTTDSHCACLETLPYEVLAQDVPRGAPSVTAPSPSPTPTLQVSGASGLLPYMTDISAPLRESRSQHDIYLSFRMINPLSCCLSGDL